VYKKSTRPKYPQIKSWFSACRGLQLSRAQPDDGTIWNWWSNADGHEIEHSTILKAQHVVLH
jgi:hypothetical protein